MTRGRSIVVAYHPEVEHIGRTVLEEGGNAFDAFVAAVAAEAVLAEGATSFAGAMGVLLYVARQRTAIYLDADFNDPLDRTWRTHSRLRRGAAALIPGLPAGLEALATRYGTRPLGDLLMPALRLATDGFPANRFMAVATATRAHVLRRSAYGRETYLRGRRGGLEAGAAIRLPEVARYLERLAKQGAAYVYEGAWGQRFLDAVRAEGGVLTRDDLAHYTVRWHEPWTAGYRGARVCSASGRAYGGLWGLLALKTFEHTEVDGEVHYSQNANALETLVRVARQVWAETWLLSPDHLDSREATQSRLSPQHTRAIWRRVIAREEFRPAANAAAHSYQIITADTGGNVASGTSTIEADPWAEALFVEGVPLTSAGTIPWSTRPGERRLSPFSMHFTLDDAGVRHAVGAISNSAAEAAFQFLINVLDYGLDPVEAVFAPRFGTFPANRRLDTSRNWVDARVSPDLVRELRRRGLKLHAHGIVDTGLGAVLSASSDVLCGATAPLPYIAAPFDVETRLHDH